LFKLESVTLLQPEQLLGQRLPGGADALAGYLRRLQELLHRAYASGTASGARTLIAAVGPNGRQQVWLTPDGLPDEEVAAVARLATTVEPPAVTGGPVVVALLYSVGSETGPHPGIVMPRSWTEIASGHAQGLTVDEIVLELWGESRASDAPATPLSDLITAVVHGGGDGAYVAFKAALLDAPMGVVLSKSTLPAGTHVVSASDQVTMPLVMTPDGRRMVKGCADPAAFSRRYGGVGGDMPGRSFLEMVLKVEEAEGVLICSAASEHSIPITRDEIAQLLRWEGTRKPWWAFWK